MVAHIAAVAAFLDVKLMALERLPPRAALLVDVRQRFGVSFLCFFLRHFHISLICRAFFWSGEQLLIAQDQCCAGVPGAERAAGAMRQRRLAILHLARTAFAAQLLDRLDHEENPAHPRMVRGEATAVRVEREIAVVAQPPARDESAALAALAEAEVLERCEHG